MEQSTDTSKLDLQKLDFDKTWSFPRPKDNYTSNSEVDDDKFVQQKFIDEYYVTGHQIFNSKFFPDKQVMIPIAGSKKDKPEHRLEVIKVKRVGLPIQLLAIDAIASHLFGNEVVHKEVAFGTEIKDETKIGAFQELWRYRNMNSVVSEFFEQCLICADAALYFYLDEEGELKTKILSALDNESLFAKRDKFGELETLYRRYKSFDEDGELATFIDAIDGTSVITYDNDGNRIESSPHGFKSIPVVYHYRQEGAFWTPAQNNIDNMEVNLSSLAEDNKTKTKSKYLIKATRPSDVQSTTVGGSDVIVTNTDGDFRLIQPAEISTAFEYEYKTIKESVFQTLGIVFPESKSSGDMPTGSMKIQFYPAERVCKQLINEFASPLDKISKLFQMGASAEFSEVDFLDMRISSKMLPFVPSDDISTLSATADALSKGALTPESMVRANSKYLDSKDVSLLIEIANKKNEAKKVEVKEEEVKEDIIEEPKEELIKE